MSAVAPTPGQAYTLAAMREDLAADIASHARHGAAFYDGRLSLKRKLSIFIGAPMLCTALFRFSHWAWCGGHRRLAWALSQFNQMLHGATLHPASRIGKGLYIPHTVGIIFEGHAGRDLVLFASAVVAGGRHPRAWTGKEGAPALGDEVSVGAHVVICGSIVVGDRTRLAPCATLHCDAPSDSLVFGGSPSRIRAVKDTLSAPEGPHGR